MSSRDPRDPGVLPFVLIAEAGPLEAQARLLCSSIRRYAGRHRNAAIIVVTPRPSRRPSAASLAHFQALGAKIVEMDIASAAPQYGTSYRIHAAAAVERQSSADVLVVLDSDIVFLGEPDLELGAHAAAARPVDVTGMCTSGPHDDRYAYWRSLCRVCDANFDDVPELVTTVDRRRVKASYNGGLVAVDRRAGILQRTEEFFVRSVRADLRPYRESGLVLRAGHGVVSGHGAEFWGSAQACLSLAIWCGGYSARLLPPTHNFPIHIPAYLEAGPRPEPVVAIHYHHLFEGDQSSNPIFHGQVNISPPPLAWLRSELPVKP